MSLDELNTHGKLMWHLTKIMDVGIINANGIEIYEVKSRF